MYYRLLFITLFSLFAVEPMLAMEEKHGCTNEKQVSRLEDLAAQVHLAQASDAVLSPDVLKLFGHDPSQLKEQVYANKWYHSDIFKQKLIKHILFQHPQKVSDIMQQCVHVCRLDTNIPIANSMLHAQGNMVFIYHRNLLGAWDVTSGRQLFMTTTTGNILSLCTSKEYVIAGDALGDIYIWHFGTNTLVAQLTHGSPVRALCIAEDTIVSAGQDGSIQLWKPLQDISTIQQEHLANVGTNIEHVAIQQGKLLAVGGSNLHIYDLGTRQHILTHANIFGSPRPKVLIADSGHIVIHPRHNATIFCYDVAGHLCWQFEDPFKQVLEVNPQTGIQANDVQINHAELHGQHVMIFNNLGYYYAIDIPSGQLLQIAPPPQQLLLEPVARGYVIFHTIFDAEENRVLCGTNGGQLMAWHLGAQLSLFQLPYEHAGHFTGIIGDLVILTTVHHETKILINGHRYYQPVSYTIRMIDQKTGQLFRTYEFRDSLPGFPASSHPLVQEDKLIIQYECNGDGSCQTGTIGLYVENLRHLAGFVHFIEKRMTIEQLLFMLYLHQGGQIDWDINEHPDLAEAYKVYNGEAAHYLKLK